VEVVGVVVGRLAEGLDDARARAEVQTLHDRFGAASRRKTGQVQVFGTAYVSRPGQSDLDVIGAVGLALLLVLLLACANVGNLQLARGFARRRELATRLAIGASRARIIRQLLIESLVLSLAAGAVAIVIAAVLPQAVLSLLGQEIPPTRVSRFRPDWPVFAFTGTVCVIACVAFGLAPALRSTHTTIPLGSMDRHSTRRLRLGLRSVLLAAQIATCTALLAAAGLVTRAIVHVMSFDPGFRTEDLLRVSAFLPSDTPDERERTFLRQLLAALERDAPDRIAVSSPSPILSDGHARIFVMRVLLGNQSAASPHVVQRRSVSRNFFEVLGIPLLKGRVFASDATGELIVNEAFARMYFAGEDPVGRPIREIDRKGGVAASHTIVGVVGDVYLSGVERIEPLVFRPTTMGTFLTRGGPAAVERIRTAALGLNAAATVRAWPIRDDLSADLEASRQGAAVAWAIGLLGLLLATVGVFGVFAYAVEERRREIGVRLALGAARAQIVRTMISTSGRAIAAGLALGILLSFACGPVLRSYLYGLSPLDPVAYGLVLALLAAAGLCATVVPARRACRVDPAVTLRED
jgi:predicted permease